MKEANTPFCLCPPLLQFGLCVAGNLLLYQCSRGGRGNPKRNIGRNSSMSGRIHFLNSLAPVQVPAPLFKGVHVVQVSANGKARPSTLKVSADKFTVTIAPVEQQSSGIFFRSNSSTGDKRGIDIGEVSIGSRLQQSTRHCQTPRSVSLAIFSHLPHTSFGSYILLFRWIEFNADNQPNNLKRQRCMRWT